MPVLWQNRVLLHGRRHWLRTWGWHPFDQDDRAVDVRILRTVPVWFAIWLHRSVDTAPAWEAPDPCTSRRRGSRCLYERAILVLFQRSVGPAPLRNLSMLATESLVDNTHALGSLPIRPWLSHSHVLLRFGRCRRRYNSATLFPACCAFPIYTCPTPSVAHPFPPSPVTGGGLHPHYARCYSSSFRLRRCMHDQPGSGERPLQPVLTVIATVGHPQRMAVRSMAPLVIQLSILAVHTRRRHRACVSPDVPV